MIPNWVLENLSYIAVLVTTLTSVIIGYYQLRHYRGQSASIKFSEIEAYYSGKRQKHHELIADFEKANLTGYELNLVIENSGREASTISSAILELPESNENLELKNRVSQTSLGRENEPITIEGNTREEIRYTAHGEPRENYEEDIEGILQLDTTTGGVEKDITINAHHLARHVQY